jgi:hypothetical protein
LSPAVALSRQDGHHSAVALLLKAALIQVSDYTLLGASGLIFVFMTFSIQLLYYFVSFSFIESIRVPFHTSLWKQQLTCTSFKISIFQVLG